MASIKSNKPFTHIIPYNRKQKTRLPPMIVLFRFYLYNYECGVTPFFVSI